MKISAIEIKQHALQVGFDLCGVAPAHQMPLHIERLRGWIAQGYHGSLGYMERNIDVRLDPAALVEGAKSVICCAVSYNNEPSFPVASFALCTDYHVTIKDMLRELALRLRLDEQGVRWRAFVDSGPLFEKAWAVEAGLGAIGRNSLLINPVWGSKILLGELVVDVEVDSYDEPMAWDCCEGCEACINNCPNEAIMDDRTIDARKCIARLTVEKREQDAPQEMLHGWVWGCDVCMDCCPHNLNAKKFTNARFEPVEKISTFVRRKHR